MLRPWPDLRHIGTNVDSSNPNFQSAIRLAANVADACEGNVEGNHQCDGSQISCADRQTAARGHALGDDVFRGEQRDLPPLARPLPPPDPPFWLPVPLSVAVCRRIGSPKVGSGYFLVITLLAACTWTRVDWERQRQGPPIGACRHQPRTRHTWEGRLKESKVAPVGSHGTDCGCGRVSPKQMVQPALVTEPFLCHWKAEPALAATPSGPMPP